MEFFKAVWRFVTLQGLRQSWKVNKAADAVFTKDAAGRAAAYDLEMETLRTDMQEFMTALSQAEVAVEQKRGQVKRLEGERGTLQKKLDGAVIVYTQAQAAGDAARMSAAEKDGAGFQAKIKGINDQITSLKSQIQVQEAGFGKLEEQFKAMKRRLDELPAEKAESIANYLGNESFIKAQERINGLLTRQHTSPLDAVRRADEELAAKAVVVGRVLGSTSASDDAYLQAAQTEAGAADFQSLVAARKAEKDAASGVAPVTEERPRI